ncbi:MAG: ASCH domain-containing protein, partial [Chloroflexota bacterium]
MHDSVTKMWYAYLHQIGETPETTNKTYTAWYFCDNEADANELAELVKKGQKRATASAVWTYEKEQEPIPQVGELSVILNWEGEAQCIICTTSVEIVPFNEVTAVFAATEGEGDGSLAYWRRVHWAFFTRDL